MTDLIERVARVLAPHLDGGQEFDKMPINRSMLRSWNRRGMCSINDATQDDAMEAASEVINEVRRLPSHD
jgi:hypothetical protein